MPQAQCCARQQSKLTMNKDRLRILARKASLHTARGGDVSRFQTQIDEVKAQIAIDRQYIADHEAEHAGVPA